jgi:hypothetical protein
MVDETKNPAAVELGKLGGKKTAERGPEYYAKIQALREKRSGGRPKLPPKVSHSGPLKIGDIEFDCAVLDDGTRVISETKFMEAMGMYRSGAVSVRRKEASAPIPLFIAHKNLKPFVEKHLGGVHFELLPYRTERGSPGRGIPAELLPKVCEVWMDANKAGVLGSRQILIAEKAEILFRSFAHVGIVALVDEATGYQYIRDRDALQAILDAYLRKELAAWAKRFPDEFYEQMFRLRGWQWKGMKINRPQVVGKYTNDLVYERLAPGILNELQERNPKVSRGERQSKHHQWLTEDVGHPALAQHLYGLIGFMRASDNWEQFYRLVQRAYPKKGDNLLLPMPEQK